MPNYVIKALENYTPAIATAFSNGTQPLWCFCDKQYIGTTFDAVGRNIFYLCLISPNTFDSNGNIFEVNTTGQTLWDGLSATPPGANIDLQLRFALYIARKNIDTGAVTFFNAYNPSNLVPSGFGSGGVTAVTIANPGSGSTNGVFSNQRLDSGSEVGPIGTLTYSGGALTNAVVDGAQGGGYSIGSILRPQGSAPTGPVLQVSAVNSGSNGSTWARTVFDTRLFGYNVQNLFNPYTGDFWVHVESCELHIFRPSTSFSMEISPLEQPFSLNDNLNSDGAPLGINANWIFFIANNLRTGALVLQIRPSTIQPADRAADVLEETYQYTEPSNYYIRYCMGPDGNLYGYGAQMSGTRNYKLWVIPQAAGYTDITPWLSTNGPNTDCAAWTFDRVNFPRHKHHIFQLHATGNLVLLSKLFPVDASQTQSNYSYFRMDCTYYNIAGTSFDYHEGFVTGYMDANWHPTTSGAAVWGVLDYLEINNYLDYSDYNYAGMDYTKRWFMFVVQAVSGGSPIAGNYYAIFAEYQFVYGQAPVLLQYYPETLWDANPAYAAYAATVGVPQIIAASMPGIGTGGSVAGYTDAFQQDNGIFDPVTNSFILSGDNPPFALFDPTFSDRYPQAEDRWKTENTGASSPFMQVFLTPTVGAGYTQGHIF